jgi:uncharacterized protein YegL
MSGQTPFTASLTLASNPEPRCPCVLVLDTSGSMAGEPIEQLQRGVQLLAEELSRDGLASKRVEIAVLAFGTQVRLLSGFVSPTAFTPPRLAPEGATPMAEAVLLACEALEARKKDYHHAGVPYYRPWIFLITDGEASDRDTPRWTEAVQRVHSAEADKKMLFFGVAVQNANQQRLDELCPPGRPSVKLKGLHFAELFRWLSTSLKSISRSAPGTQLQLPSPNGWISIDL